MPESMEDRKKAGSLVAKWVKIKGRHKALNSGNLFKPDIAPVLEDYDDIFPEYDKLDAEKGKLKEVLDGLKKSLTDNSKKSASYSAEIEKLTAEDSPMVADLAKLDAEDPGEVQAGLNSFAADFQDSMNKRQALWDKINEVGSDTLSQIKQASADYKSKADGIVKRMKELETSAERLDTQIQTHLGKFVDTADEMDHDDIVKDLEDLKKSF